MNCAPLPLGQWTALQRYLEEGVYEIDNNLVENATRSTCLGKKNWLFIGHPDAGWRNAVIYSVLDDTRTIRVRSGGLVDRWFAAYSTGNEPYGCLTPAVELETSESLIRLGALWPPPSIVEYPIFGNEGPMGLGVRLQTLYRSRICWNSCIGC